MRTFVSYILLGWAAFCGFVSVKGFLAIRKQSLIYKENQMAERREEMAEFFDKLYFEKKVPYTWLMIDSQRGMWSGFTRNDEELETIELVPGVNNLVFTGTSWVLVNPPVGTRKAPAR